MNNTEYARQLNISLDYLAKKDYQTAENILQNLIKQFPDKLDAYFLLGKMLAEHLGNIIEGRKYMLQAVEVAPFFEGYQALAEFSFILQNIPDALGYLKLALLYNSTSEKCLSYLNRAFPNEKNYVNNNKIKIKGSYEKSYDCPFVKYNKSYSAGVIERKPPQFIDELLTTTQRELLEKALDTVKVMSYSDGFTIKIPDGKVFIKQSGSPLIITPDKMLLEDTFTNFTPRNLNEFSNSLRFTDKLLVLMTATPGNFYHCMTWIIPKIKMLEEAGYNLKKFDKIAINYQGFKFQRELISLLKIPFDKVVGTNPNGVVLGAKELVATSSPCYRTTPPIVLQSLREKLLKPEYYDENSPKRIYLSRNKSVSRHVLNEDDLTSFLEKEKFVVIYAEDYTIEEQIKLFANAEFVISQHGAGLTNLAFCSPETKVIEIFNERMKEFLDTGFIRLAADAQLKHVVMFGEAVNNSDMYIDMRKFRANYELINN